jgi:hypothetical protein
MSSGKIFSQFQCLFIHRIKSNQIEPNQIKSNPVIYTCSISWNRSSGHWTKLVKAVMSLHRSLSWCPCFIQCIIRWTSSLPSEMPDNFTVRQHRKRCRVCECWILLIPVPYDHRLTRPAMNDRSSSDKWKWDWEDKQFPRNIFIYQLRIFSCSWKSSVTNRWINVQ